MRRADLFDRGRRLVPAGGKFGTLVIETNNSQFYVNMITADAVLQTWKFYNGETVTMPGVNLTHTFDPDLAPNNGGKVKLTDALTWLNLNGPPNNNGITKVMFTGPFSNLEVYRCRGNSLLESLPSYDTWTSITEIDVATNKLNSFDTFASWTELVDFSIHSNGYNGGLLSSLDTFDTWTKLETFYVYNNYYLETCEFQEWPALTDLRAYGTLLGANGFTTYDWPNIEYLHLGDPRPNGDCTSFVTRDTWTNMWFFALNNHSDPGVGSIELHSTWSSLTDCFLTNSGLSTVTMPATGLTSLDTFFLNNNDLNAAAIDDILIKMDGYGVSNGSLNYAGNPGSDDGDRSGAAATAKTNLIARGWAVTS